MHFLRDLPIKYFNKNGQDAYYTQRMLATHSVGRIKIEPKIN